MHLNTFLMVITIIVGVVSLLGTVFAVGKFTGKLTEAINTAVDVFTVKITNIVEDIRELKQSNEKLADALNDLTTIQITEMKENIVRVDESTKSAHCRIGELKCLVDRRLG